MNKHLSWAIIIISAGWLLSSCKDDKANTQPAAPPPVPVNVYTVTKGRASYYDQYPATITPLNQVDLRPQVNGYLTGVFFKDGSRVRKGQKLYTIDQQQYMANYQQAQANLQVQETNLMKAQKDADRYHELEKHDAIAKQQVDYADAALEAAKKQVAAAKANVASVQTGLRYTTIFAPFDGTIGISQAKLGTAVSAGQTLLNTISSDDPMAVDVAIDQKDLYRFTQLQKKGAGRKDSTFKLILPGGETYPYPGQIYTIDRAVDPQTGTIKARLLFPNKESDLKAGMTANVQILNNANTEKLLIPHKAVVEQMGEYFVYTTDGKFAHQKKVSLGARIGGQVIINEGLNEGEQVITDGLQKLKEGAPVQVAQTEQAAAPATAR
ncbi:efflux RND transporter periplasmic adaptor subunit [Longitalea luteola]|uniref:efflux RND transporter periplasmic adaptor subunit n=1 Tax=Longitalea luteola TaxID=2812563 RepID=UPI001A9650DB|nr:efflux RND transporter periplasmic adaptor subunit [Longitalea luteola]